MLEVVAYALNEIVLQLQLLENWKYHVQRGLQIAAARYARLRLAQAGERDIQTFDAFKVSFSTHMAAMAGLLGRRKGGGALAA